MFRRLAEYPPQQTNRAAGPNTSTPHRGECTYPERPVGPPNHSPGRNPGVQRYTRPKRAPGPEWMYRPARIRPHRVPGPPRVSPWAMIRRPYRAHGYPGRPDGPPQQTNGPQGPNKPTIQRGVCGRRRSWPGIRRGARPFLRVRICHFGPPLRYDHIAIFPLISFSSPPKSVLSLWQIFT